MVNTEDITNGTDRLSKGDGKLYDQIKRRLSSYKGDDAGEEKLPLKMDELLMSPGLIAINLLPVAQNELDNFLATGKVKAEDIDLNKIQSMEESIQRNLKVLEETQPIEKEENIPLSVEEENNNDNEEEDALVITEVKGTYFGLRDLEEKILEIIKVGGIEMSDKENAPPSEEEDVYRRQFIQQIPPNDFLTVKDIEDEYEQKEKEMFLLHLNQEAIGKAIYMDKDKITDSLNCSFCEKAILSNESFKFTDRLPDRAFHHDCFKCTTCKQTLVDDIYFSDKDNLYCGRHYAEIYKGRCTDCDELIFSKEYTVAEDQKWHIKHFCCFSCHNQLGGASYVLENSHTYCISCYHELVACKCECCSQPIEIDTEWINFEERNWHASAKCFCCYACKKDLCDMPFVPLGDNIFCSLECLKS